MSQCFNIVYLAGGFMHAQMCRMMLNANGSAFVKLAKDHWCPAPPKLRQNFLGVGVKL
jgi:hypothetical protein